MSEISRQTVLESFRKICNICGKDKKYDGVMCRACYLGDAIDIVEELPSVQPEQPEIIRCRDCKHMIEHENYGDLGEPAYTCEGNMTGWVLLDSFCSWAERRTDG